jgi:triosephosphate isomerase
MEKKLIKEVVPENLCWLLYGKELTLEEINSMLKNVIDKANDMYPDYSSFVFEFGGDYCNNYEPLVLIGTRLETDSEYDYRIIQRIRQEKEKERIKKIAQFNRLKKELGL